MMNGERTALFSHDFHHKLSRVEREENTRVSGALASRGLGYGGGRSVRFTEAQVWRRTQNEIVFKNILPSSL